MDTSQSTALAKPTAGFSLVPNSFKEAQDISEYLAKSDLVPRDYQGKAANILVAIAWGAEVGLQPLQAVQNIAVINGRGSIWGDAALALCMSRPDFEDIVEKLDGEDDSRVATCTIKRKGRSPVTRTFSVADAKKAGLWSPELKVKRWDNFKKEHVEKANDSPWHRYDARMLQMRARGFALRDSFPDAMRGLYLAEELQGTEPQEVEVNAAPSRAAVSMPQSASATAETAQTREVIDTETGEVFQTASGNVEKTEAAPQQAAEGVVTLSDGQLKIVRAKAHAASLDDAGVAHQFNVDRIEAIPATDVNKVLDWIKSQAKK